MCSYTFTKPISQAGGSRCFQTTDLAILTPARVQISDHRHQGQLDKCSECTFANQKI